MIEQLSQAEIKSWQESYHRPKMLKSMSDLNEYLAARTGNETVGDTLIRFSRLLSEAESHRQGVSEVSDEGVDANDWSAWLEELGERLNEAVRKP